MKTPLNALIMGTDQDVYVERILVGFGCCMKGKQSDNLTCQIHPQKSLHQVRIVVYIISNTIQNITQHMFVTYYTCCRPTVDSKDNKLNVSKSKCLAGFGSLQRFYLTLWGFPTMSGSETTCCTLKNILIVELSARAHGKLVGRALFCSFGFVVCEHMTQNSPTFFKNWLHNLYMHTDANCE